MLVMLHPSQWRMQSVSLVWKLLSIFFFLSFYFKIKQLSDNLFIKLSKKCEMKTSWGEKP